MNRTSFRRMVENRTKKEELPHKATAQHPQQVAEKPRSIQKIRYSLDGKTLLIDRVTTFNSIPASDRPTCIVDSIAKVPLMKITAEELQVLRDAQRPGFVFKENGNYYFAKIPAKTNLVSEHLLGAHLCATCPHLSAKSDEEGGCAKVRNRSMFIENYDFVVVGYETIGTVCNAFDVVKCTNHA